MRHQGPKRSMDMGSNFQKALGHGFTRAKSLQIPQRWKQWESLMSESQEPLAEGLERLLKNPEAKAAQ